MDLNGLELTWLGHAAVRLRLGEGTTIYLDPWLTGNPACPGHEQHPERANAVFLTHGHSDHFGDTLDLALRLQAEVFCMNEIAVYLSGHGASRVVGLNKGGTVTGPGGLRATMVHALHSGGLDAPDGIRYGGEAAGWVLSFPGGPTLYHAGDTMIFGDMALIGDLWAPDIAFLPIGGHYTMDPLQAARAARMLGVSAVVPIHYGTFPVLTGTPQQLAEALGSEVEVATLTPGVPVGG
ncbi:MAG TPA: metal-dependent hydrolase [Acidimicrobiia bacterium]|nr:metal-dependent hydrolase [Acidimicrobiia bacterium]